MDGRIQSTKCEQGKNGSWMDMKNIKHGFLCSHIPIGPSQERCNNHCVQKHSTEVENTYWIHERAHCSASKGSDVKCRKWTLVWVRGLSKRPGYGAGQAPFQTRRHSLDSDHQPWAVPHVLCWWGLWVRGGSLMCLRGEMTWVRLRPESFVIEC